MLSVNQSPYLINNNRLADVIAAIQVIGSYRFYKLDFAEWSNRISGDESKADYWRKVLEEHPERHHAHLSGTRPQRFAAAAQHPPSLRWEE